MNDTTYTMGQFAISVIALVVLFLIAAHLEFLSNLY